MHNIFQALEFAAQKHRDQRRKDQEASPYINHLIAVANLLWNVEKIRNLDIIIAAILHDTLEDTETQASEIAQLFGEKVLGYVQEVTDDKSLPKQRRKDLQVEHAPHKSAGAKLIKLADKCSNLHDILHSPPTWTDERKRQYIEWAKQVVDGLRGEAPRLEQYFDELVAEGKGRLSEK